MTEYTNVAKRSTMAMTAGTEVSAMDKVCPRDVQKIVNDFQTSLYWSV